MAMTRFENITACGAAGFVVAFVAISLMLKAERRQPSARHAEFHHSDNSKVPISRFGGLALVAAFMVVLCLPWRWICNFEPDYELWVIVGTSLAMFGLGFWDDVRPLGAKRKLLGQVAIASAAYFLGLEVHLFKTPLLEHIVDLGPYSWPLTVFWLVAMTNLINLIDGVDGLAGGIALMVMVLLSVVGSGAGVMPQVAAGVAGALVAFLRFNFPPAKIYLGDGGAYFLGFLIGGLTIYNSQKGTVVAALIAPLFVLALPILDTSLSILRRGLNGLPLFRPDQGHLHHRLLQSGLSRQNVTLGAYIFTAYFLGLGLVAFWWRGQFLALALGGATTAILLLAYRFRFSREWFNVANVLESSLKARSEINYALAHSRWLAMEGERGRSIQDICEDTARVARRLGFIGMRIRFQDDETVWRLTDCPNWESCSKLVKVVEKDIWMQAGVGTCQSHVFRHHLPGETSCYLELQTPNLSAGAPAQCLAAQGGNPHHLIDPSKYKIVSEVLAEGWAKSVIDWQRLNHQPICLPARAKHKAGQPGFGFSSGPATADGV